MTEGLHVTTGIIGAKGLFGALADQVCVRVRVRSRYAPSFYATLRALERAGLRVPGHRAGGTDDAGAPLGRCSACRLVSRERWAQPNALLRAVAVVGLHDFQRYRARDGDLVRVAGCAGTGQWGTHTRGRAGSCGTRRRRGRA